MSNTPRLLASAAERYPMVSAFTKDDVYEMALVEGAFLYVGGGDGFYYRGRGVTHYMEDNGAAWRAKVEGRKMTPRKLVPVESF